MTKQTAADIKHIHEHIIDNPDFNLTVAAKRDLRELCAWVEEYRKHGKEILDAQRKELEQVEAERDELLQIIEDMEPVKTQAELDFAIAEVLRLDK